MISITGQWLRDHWPKLEGGQMISARFSAWDDGDAFTLASLGQLPSPDSVEGQVLVGNAETPNAAVVIRLLQAEPHTQLDGTAQFEAPNGQLYIVTGEEAVSGTSQSSEVNLIDIGSELSSRRSPILETDVLSESNVLIVGLGTGGAYVAVELAKCGVGEFVLVDSDRLDVANVSRHHAGISHVGRRKVFVVRDMILESNPLAHVEAHSTVAIQSSEQMIEGFIDQVELVICATDTRSSKLFMNRLSVASNRTAIYGGAFRRAYGGQVLRVRPGQSPCYQCFVLAMSEQEADREISSEEEAEWLAYSDRPEAPEPGLSLDVAPIAQMVTKLALQELLQGKQSALRVLDSDFSAPWYLWVNRPEENTPYRDWPPLSDSSDEMTIMRWYGVHLEREKGCPVCGDFDRAARQIFGIPGGELPEIQHRLLPAQSDDKDETVESA